MKRKEVDIYLEITNYCNFYCDFCPSKVMKRKRQHLNFEDGKSFLLDVVKKYEIRLIQLNVLGEPTLNSDIYKYLDLCQELNLNLYLISNASMLSKDIALLKKILSYRGDIVLVLSLQTIHELDYKSRHFLGMSYNEYFNSIFDIIRQKFLYKSNCIVEIHVSSNYLYQTFNTYYKDSDVQIYNELDYEETFPIFLENLKKKVTELKSELNDELNNEFNSDLIKRDYENRHTFFGIESMPEDIWKTENACMFLPDCYLAVKQFGFWTKEKNFIKMSLENKNPNKFIYIDKQLGSGTCSMANNIGLLSNGDIITCCLDYEGEMNLGNIKDTSINSDEFIKKQQSITENPLQYEICQRCKGHMYLFDKSLLYDNIQKIEAYSWDWNDKENNMWGKEGRWSKELSTTYVYSRINGNILSLNAKSSNGGGRLKIYQYDFETERFFEQFYTAFYCVENEFTHLEFKNEFTYGCFYKIEIISPAFCPKDKYDTEDSRFLGLAVFDMYIELRKELIK